MLKNNKLLWTLQILLAALYLFAGGFKVVASAASLTAGGPSPLPIWFLRTIGVLECLGALGLLLPGLTGIRRGLTPLAASCLVVIMIGAAITSLPLGGATVVLPVVAGILDLVVAVGRRDWASPSASAAAVGR